MDNTSTTNKAEKKHQPLQKPAIDAKRESWVDWSKALLIWLMVLGHAGISDMPQRIIYSFHMPAFFMISGYLYKPHGWRKTLKSFGVPVLLFSLINLCYVILKMNYMGNAIDAHELLKKITPPLYRCNFGENITLFTGIWFIVDLFCMRLLLGDLPGLSFFRKYVYWLIPIFVLYMSAEPLFENLTRELHPYYVYKVIACMPFMMAGLVLKERKNILMNLSKYNIIFLFIIYVALILVNVKTEIWAYIFQPSYFLCFVCALVASLLLFNVCKKFSVANRIAETFSKGTFLILGLHGMIIQVSNKIYDIVGLPHIGLATSIIVMLLCYFPIRFALRYCPAILGKS